MKPRVKRIDQQFDDGVLSIYSIVNDAPPGGMPTEKLLLKHGGIRYADRTVGLNRFWQGRREEVLIERVLRCPKLPGVTRLGVVETEDGQRYQIEQVQYLQGIEPPSMDLTLSVVGNHYDVAEVGDGDDDL